MSLRTIVLLTCVSVTHAGVTFANPARALPTESPVFAAEATELSTPMTDEETQIPSFDEPDRSDAREEAERLVMFSGETVVPRTNAWRVELSLVDDEERSGRLELEGLTTGIEIDSWDRASVHPTGVAGWLSGRVNSWGVEGHSTEEVLADMFNDMGCTLPAGITAGLLASSSPSQQRAGKQARDAIIATSAATHLLKAVIDSPRPKNPQNLEGFPSGHTSMSMAFARAISNQHRDWGTVAYLWAGGVGWSRVRRGDHSTEQVIAGAVLGWLVADAVTRERNGGITMSRGGRPTITAGRGTW